MARSPVVQLLPCALLLLNLLCASIALVTFSDVAGNYTLVQGILNICADTAEISNTTSTLAARTLAARRLSFDGKPCLTGSFPLVEATGRKSWSEIDKAKVGIRLKGFSSELRCQAYRLSNVSVYFMRPIADLEFTTGGFKDYYLRRKGVKYFEIKNSGGGCLYHEAPADTSPISTPTVSHPNNDSGIMDANGKEKDNSNNSSVDPAAKEEKKGSGQSMWVWLGPVIGAGATIIAAIITAFTWPCRAAEKDVQRLGVHDYDHEY